MAAEWERANGLVLRAGPMGTVRVQAVEPEQAPWVSRRWHHWELEQARRQAAEEVRELQWALARAEARIRSLEQEREALRRRLGQALKERRSWKRKALGEELDVSPVREIVSVAGGDAGEVWRVTLDAAPDAPSGLVYAEALRQARADGAELRRVVRTRQGWEAELLRRVRVPEWESVSVLFDLRI